MLLLPQPALISFQVEEALGCIVSITSMAKSASCGLVLACLAVAVAVGGATQFTVGGANGWAVPPAGAEPFNTWALRTRFQIGDSLVFVYPKDQDSVLLVEPADYNACNTSSYVKRFDDGDTVVTLDRAGALFFISGVEANCRANEKLIVMVLASGGGGGGNGSAPAPSTATPPPPPAPTTTPPPSPPPPASPAPEAPAAPAPGSAAPPTATPGAPPPAPASTTTPPPPAPAGAAPQPPPSASAPAPSARGGAPTTNSTGTRPSPPRPAGPKDKSAAAVTVATGLAGSFGASIVGYAMLAL